MTDQEFEGKLDELMTQEPQAGKKKKKKKRRILIGVAVLAVVLLAAWGLLGGNQESGIPVMTQNLTKGDVQEMLSISGPVSGTDSAEVVSNLHAEILEITVKEGDVVEEGQMLARLDPTDAQKDVDIAQNAYDLAVANMDEAQIQAENGYAKAQQDLYAAQLDSQRKEVLFASGDIAQTEIEAAQNALNDARRVLSEYTIVDGRPKANRSFALQVKNAGFELEQKKKNLTETEVKSPIAGTVVRVNSRVGRFADIVDDDKPLFSIDNLEKLEMKINVSEYSIGKVLVGQSAAISADILDGEVEQGIITSISPTGEEKGGGSTERVIPTTIQILNENTKLIAGITAKAEIVLAESKDTWSVPVSAILELEGGSYLAAVEAGMVKLIPVTTGVESDIAIEINGEGLNEELIYIITPDAGMEDGTPVMVLQ
ncbi:MAG: efflux RND transporter periplasmic adaptor subunit [Lachnospiraceae bacterium]